MPGSSLVRESDLALMTNAGTEIGVASTKAFTTQLTVLLMLVAKLSRLKGLDASIEHDIVHGLQALPSRIEQMLSQDKRIELLAEDFSDKHHALFTGRGDQYPIALEGALKLKEISYIHAEAYAAGELKHGPLALIDADMPVIVVAPNNELLEKLKSNIEEVRARGGQLYVFADQDAGFVSNDNMHIIEMPHVEEVIAPIFYTVPLQLLAYHVALIKGTDVDQPRNPGEIGYRRVSTNVVSAEGRRQTAFLCAVTGAVLSMVAEERLRGATPACATGTRSHSLL